MRVMDSMAESIWEDLEGDACVRNLEVAISRLRKYIGLSEAIRFQDQRVSLDTTCCWVDVWAFQEIAAAARATTGTQRVPMHQSALALYDGHFLASEADSGWLLGLRAALKDTWLSLAAELGTSLETAGRADEAMHLYAKVIAHDVTAELFYQKRIRLLLEAGDRIGALETYGRCRAALAELLGIETSATTRALIGRVE